MKKYLCAFICMAISLALLAGCGTHDNCNSAVETKNPVTQTASSHPVETPDWEITKYDTVNNFDDVTMTVKQGTASATGLTAALANNSSSHCIYGEYFCLEKKVNGSWYQVPVIIGGEAAFNNIGYELASGKDREWPVDWKRLYGGLETGEYRIVKDIMDFRGTGDYDKYYLAADFTVL